MSFSESRLQVAREKVLYFEQGKIDFLSSLFFPAAAEIYSLNPYNPSSFAGIHWQIGFNSEKSKKGKGHDLSK